MSFLNEWVRGLVMLVILAGCLELLLPMNNMKKYVRMTMSLLIVLSVVQPILTFLRQPVSVNASLLEDPNDSQMASLSEIMARADQFRTQNQALTARELNNRLAGEAAAAARTVEGVGDATATVATAQTGEETKVQEVSVTVVPGAAPTAVKPVQIAPVVIGAKESQEAAETQREPTPAEQRLADAVRREVADRLGIKADAQIIRVVVAQAGR